MTGEDHLVDPGYQEMLREMKEKGLDIGHGVTISFYTYKGVRAGIHEIHTRPDGLLCIGGVQFNLPETADLTGAKWTLNNLEPLDISPSVLCTSCGSHGFIRDGKWVPA